MQQSGAAIVAVVFWVVISPVINRGRPLVLSWRGQRSHSSILCGVVIVAEGDGMPLSAPNKNKATMKVNQPHNIRLLGYQLRLSTEFKECFGPGLPLAVA